MSKVSVIFVSPDGEENQVSGEIGITLLELAQSVGIDIEGACEGNMACSTCHLVVEDDFFGLLPKASEDEEEMLDLASDLRRTSRLGCQVVLTKELDGMHLFVPKNSRNMMGL